MTLTLNYQQGLHRQSLAGEYHAGGIRRGRRGGYEADQGWDELFAPRKDRVPVLRRQGATAVDVTSRPVEESGEPAWGYVDRSNIDGRVDVSSDSW